MVALIYKKVAGMVLVLAVLAAVSTASESEDRRRLVCDASKYEINGQCNNLGNPTWGMPNTVYVRHEPVAFSDGLKAKRDGPNERTISQVLAKDTPHFGNPHLLTLLLPFFGQFLAHDVASTRSIAEVGDTDEHLTYVEIEDPNDPFYTLSQDDPPAMQVGLSALHTDGFGVGHPINEITHFVDLSSVYGSHAELLSQLRSHEGGRLILTDYRVDGRPFGLSTILLRNQLPNEAMIGVEGHSFLRKFVPPEERLLAGDLRVIENPELGAYHLLWVLEHNRYAAELALQNPDWTDDQLFERAREWTVASYQNVVFYEFVRAVVGPVLFAGVETYGGYNPMVDPRMDVSFVTSAFRFGHTMIPDDIPILDIESDTVIGSLPVVGLFHGKFGPLTANLITRGQANLLYSLYVFGAREPDEKASDTMRNFPDPFDVLAANLVRERLHGLPAYNSLRKARHPAGAAADIYQQQGCAPEYESSPGDDPLGCFMSITHDMEKAELLRQLYGKVKYVDGFMGMMMEHTPTGSALGKTQGAIFVDQFMRSRDGDRWWFENTANGLFTAEEVTTIKSRRLADIISDNFDVPREKLGEYVFVNPKSATV